MDLRFENCNVDWALGDLSDTPAAPPLRFGRRIDFPKGDHRRPPASFHSAIYGKAFGIL